MKRLALAVALVAAAIITMLATPSAHAQARCGGKLCLGSPASTGTVKMLGNLELDKPVFPTDATLGMVVDGGVTIVGAATVNGQIKLKAPFNCGADVACGSVALASASPSTATKTVTAGSTCVCWPVGTSAAIAAGGCAANVSGTTATFTGPNTVTTTVFWMCFK